MVSPYGKSLDFIHGAAHGQGIGKGRGSQFIDPFWIVILIKSYRHSYQNDVHDMEIHTRYFVGQAQPKLPGYLDFYLISP